jgi:hypothetical protein
MSNLTLGKFAHENLYYSTLPLTHGLPGLFKEVSFFFVTTEIDLASQTN